MLGGWWLENPALLIVLFCIAFYLLYKALRIKKQYRYHQHSDHNDVQRVIGAHFLADYTFHLYDTTPIGKFTHGLSGMVITVLVLNFYLTRKRHLYYFVAIGASWIAFVL